MRRHVHTRDRRTTETRALEVPDATIVDDVHGPLPTADGAASVSGGPTPSR